MGILGVGLASVLVSISSIIPYFLVRRHIKFALLPQITPPLLASIVMIAVLTWVQNFMPNNFFYQKNNYLGLSLIVITGAFSYTIALLLIDRKKVFDRGKTFITMARK